MLVRIRKVRTMEKEGVEREKNRQIGAETRTRKAGEPVKITNKDIIRAGRSVNEMS